uniref:Uncharacterized protein n=1 Tax=Zea mays TaxID=4577 RepID=C4J888_MAIZE|nr:unknown [Zea mays]
MEGGRTQADT